MGSRNLLTSTSGDDWTVSAKQLAARNSNPSTAAIASLLSEANARVPFSQATGVLDNGCGPGSIMSSLLESYAEEIAVDCSLTCADFSEGMIQAVKDTREKRIHAGETKHWPRLHTMVSNAMDMTAIASQSQSHVLAGWVYFMTPDPQKCLSESKSMLKDGGVLALSSWKGSQWLQLMGELTSVFPDRAIPSLPENWSSTEAVKDELEKAGFVDVKSILVTVYMGYQSHAEIVKFLLGNVPPMVAAMKGLSVKEVKQVEDAMVEKCKDLNPEEPGRFSGEAIIAVGSK